MLVLNRFWLRMWFADFFLGVPDLS